MFNKKKSKLEGPDFPFYMEQLKTRKKMYEKWFLDIGHQTMSSLERATNKVSSMIIPAYYLQRASKLQHRNRKPKWSPVIFLN